MSSISKVIQETTMAQALNKFEFKVGDVVEVEQINARPDGKVGWLVSIAKCRRIGAFHTNTSNVKEA